MNLEELAIKYNTDKHNIHKYMDKYKELFKPIKDEVKTVLELGILGGGSLRMWRDYFPNAIIYGLDCNPNDMFTEPRIKTYIGRQENIRDLETVCYSMRHPTIDIIIDDCSHLFSAQMISFGYLIHKLKEGGYYIIEDMIEHPMWIADYNFILRNFTEMTQGFKNLEFFPPYIGKRKQNLFIVRKRTEEEMRYIKSQEEKRRS